MHLSYSIPVGIIEENDEYYLEETNNSEPLPVAIHVAYTPEALICEPKPYLVWTAINDNRNTHSRNKTINSLLLLLLMCVPLCLIVIFQKKN